MQNLRVLLFSMVLITFFSIPTQAQVVKSFGLENLGEHVLFTEDKTGKLTYSEVQNLSDKNFTQGKKQILNFKNTTSAWWIKIRYQAQPGVEMKLLIDAPNIEHIDAYTNNFEGKTIKYHTGSLIIPSSNVTVGSSFMLHLPESETSEIKTVYLRLQSNNILLAPIKLMTSNQMLENRPLKNGMEFIYIGLLIGLLLYNLFLFFSIKDVTYLYYVLYVFALSTYIITYLRGYSFVFGDEIRILLNTYPHALMGLCLIALLIFSHKFLIIDVNARKFQSVFRFFYIPALLLLLCSLLGYKPIASTLTQILSLISTLIVWLAGITAYRNGHKPAKYFIIAWTLILVSTIIVIFSLEGTLPQNEFTILLVPLSTIIELLILSFALGDRYKQIMQTEQRLRDENISLIKTQNQRLEESVKERTLQLNQTITELEESNAVKNKLFSIIAHDLKSPLNSLVGILSLNDMQILNSEELHNLLSENRKTIDSVTNTINNLLHWARGQMEGTVTEVSTFNLNDVATELLDLYIPLIKKKSITLLHQADYKGLVVADQNQINLVIRNLMDNAIKFTRLGGQIELIIQEKAKGVKFCISNDLEEGHEIDLSKLKGEKIVTSTIGTQNERGVGLGIFLCHEYIKNNGSSLKIHLADGRIYFSFYLKAA